MVEIYFDLTPEAISDANNIISVLTDPIEYGEDEQVISTTINNDAVCLVDSQRIGTPFSIIANRINNEIIYLIADLEGFSQVFLPSDICISMDAAYFACEECEGKNCECCTVCDHPCDAFACGGCDHCSPEHDPNFTGCASCDPIEDPEIQTVEDLPSGNEEFNFKDLFTE